MFPAPTLPTLVSSIGSYFFHNYNCGWKLNEMWREITFFVIKSYMDVRSHHDLLFEEELLE